MRSILLVSQVILLLLLFYARGHCQGCFVEVVRNCDAVLPEDCLENECTVLGSSCGLSVLPADDTYSWVRYAGPGETGEDDYTSGQTKPCGFFYSCRCGAQSFNPNSCEHTLLDPGGVPTIYWVTPLVPEGDPCQGAPPEEP